MKKLVFGLALAALAATGANAQRVINNPDNKPFWGVRASLDISCPTDVTYKYKGDKESEKVFGNGTGFSIGAVYNLPIVANFYFEPGVSLFYNTWKWNEGDLLDDIDGVDLKHNSLRQTGMRIPLNLGYHFDFTDDFKVSIFTGPQLELGFHCDSYVTAEAKVGGKTFESHNAYSMYKDYDDEGPALNRFNMAWNIGVGFTYQKFYLGVTGSLGMTHLVHTQDLDKDESVTSHMNTVGIALGYNF